MSTAEAEEDPSYIDYEAFLSPDFKPSAFANTLVLSTNNANDLPLDLSTPLSRVLFDIQEIDSHIDVLTTKSAVPLIEHTKAQNEASGRIVRDVDAQVKSLNESYKQLEKEVIVKHAEADEVRCVAQRLWETLRIGRSLGRCLQLGRQLEIQFAELGVSAAGKQEDHRALVRCAHTVLALREILDQKGPGEEGQGLDKVDAIRSLRGSVLMPKEQSVRETAERYVREFSTGSSPSSTSSTTTTFAQAEESKARAVSALMTLYLLSPTALAKNEKWAPTAMIQALDSYLRIALQSSLAALARSLAQLPTLERTLNEVAARCQNIVALEVLLENTKAPAHPLAPLLPSSVANDEKGGNLLQPLLASLETGSLASYFWRSLASKLSTKVQEIVNRGGAAARVLRSSKNNVGDAIKECVIKGSRMPSTVTTTKGKSVEKQKTSAWDREVAVMVGSVVGNIR